jgi:serine palmitoyltransferase
MKTPQDQNGNVSQMLDSQNQDSDESLQEAPFITACLTYLGFCLLMIVGFINQLFFMPEVATEKERDGYVPLFESYQTFYFYYV